MIGDRLLHCGLLLDQRLRCWLIGFELLCFLADFFLPATHIITVARGAEKKALRMREYPAAALQGLIQENHSPDGNLFERRFIRYAGFGAFNRVGALVFEPSQAGVYTIPTGYTTPLAV